MPGTAEKGIAMPLTRRRLLLSTVALGAAYGLGFASRDVYSYISRPPVDRARAAVLPEKGIATGLRFGDAVARLVVGGALVPGKLEAVYRRRGTGLPDWVSRAMAGEADDEIVLDRDSAPYLLNLLWPLGIANRTAVHDRNPISERWLRQLASTGGWTLGETANGADYYNRIEALALTAGQEDMVERMAAAIYRPCCNNPAVFPDCNHGAAMLGFLELAAAAGLPERRIWELAKALNGFWYPEAYLAMALLFDLRDGLRWSAVPPEVALGRKHASISGWRANVDAPLAALGDPDGTGTPAAGGSGGGCGV